MRFSLASRLCLFAVGFVAALPSPESHGSREPRGLREQAVYFLGPSSYENLQSEVAELKNNGTVASLDRRAAADCRGV